MQMQRYSSILFIVLEEEYAQKFIQAELETHLARTFISCDAYDMEENITQLWGAAMDM